MTDVVLAGEIGEPARAVMALAEILDDRPALRHPETSILDQRRLAERVGGFQLGRCEIAGGVAPVGHDLVIRPELLEEPEDSLRPRIVEVVDGDHARSPISIR